MTGVTGILYNVEVSGFAVMVKNDLLVKFVIVRHGIAIKSKWSRIISRKKLDAFFHAFSQCIQLFRFIIKSH